jgi:hypothetical protein
VNGNIELAMGKFALPLAVSNSILANGCVFFGNKLEAD